LGHHPAQLRLEPIGRVDEPVDHHDPILRNVQIAAPEHPAEPPLERVFGKANAGVGTAM